MDFTIVKRQIIGEYISLYGNDRPGETWSLESCLNVFRYFYYRYRETFGTDHPNLTNATINRIILDFPYLDDENRNHDVIELEPESYQTLIDAYFMQDFDNCNYSIAHFMSGNIRMLRFYEELY